jgi:hypothetical protein
LCGLTRLAMCSCLFVCSACDAQDFTVHPRDRFPGTTPQFELAKLKKRETTSVSSLSRNCKFVYDNCNRAFHRLRAESCLTCALLPAPTFYRATRLCPACLG